MTGDDDDFLARTEDVKCTSDWVQFRIEYEGDSVSDLAERKGVTEAMIEWWLAVARLPSFYGRRILEHETATGGD